MKRTRLNDGHKKGTENRLGDDSYGDELDEEYRQKQELEEVRLSSLK